MWRRVGFDVCVLLTAACLLAVTGCSKVWRGAAIDARVVDASTNQPIAGALMTANWQLVGLEGYPVGQLDVVETRTKQDGTFRIPAWGPRTAPIWAALRNDQPTVRVYKLGYLPLTKSNVDFGVRAPEPVQLLQIHANVDGRSLSLSKFDGTPEEYAKAMDAFWMSLGAPFTWSRCDWKLAPMLFHELSEMKTQFENLGIESSLVAAEDLCR